MSEFRSWRCTQEAISEERESIYRAWSMSYLIAVSDHVCLESGGDILNVLLEGIFRGQPLAVVNHMAQVIRG